MLGGHATGVNPQPDIVPNDHEVVQYDPSRCRQVRAVFSPRGNKAVADRSLEII
jgi:hypothetical protein